MEVGSDQAGHVGWSGIRADPGGSGITAGF